MTIDNKNEQLDTVVKYDDDSQVPPTFINKYSTTLPEAGGAGLTMTYLAGASLLCFARHGCMLVAIAIGIEVVAVSRLNRRLLAPRR